MTMSTRLLETGFEIKFHALQIIFVRMLATAICALLYMWLKKIPDAPFGPRHVRGLLILRGFAGFAGLFCAYCERSRVKKSFMDRRKLIKSSNYEDALSYLNLSDSTVISFLTPILTAFICFVALRVSQNIFKYNSELALCQYF